MKQKNKKQTNSKNSRQIIQSNGDIITQLLFDTDETCKMLSIHDRNILDTYRKKALIRCIKIGKRYLFPLEEIEKFIKNNIGNEITYDGIIFEG